MSAWDLLPEGNIYSNKGRHKKLEWHKQKKTWRHNQWKWNFIWFGNLLQKKKRKEGKMEENRREASDHIGVGFLILWSWNCNCHSFFKVFCFVFVFSSKYFVFFFWIFSIRLIPCISALPLPQSKGECDWDGGLVEAWKTSLFEREKERKEKKERKKARIAHLVKWKDEKKTEEKVSRTTERQHKCNQSQKRSWRRRRTNKVTKIQKNFFPFRLVPLLFSLFFPKKFL